MSQVSRHGIKSYMEQKALLGPGLHPLLQLQELDLQFASESSLLPRDEVLTSDSQS